MALEDLDRDLKWRLDSPDGNILDVDVRLSCEYLPLLRYRDLANEINVVLFGPQKRSHDRSEPEGSLRIHVERIGSEWRALSREPGGQPVILEHGFLVGVLREVEQGDLGTKLLVEF